MAESIPTTWNDEHAADFFAISDRMLDHVLENLVAAESWEAMALRSATRSEPQRRSPVRSTFADAA